MGRTGTVHPPRDLPSKIKIDLSLEPLPILAFEPKGIVRFKFVFSCSCVVFNSAAHSSYR
jgi:hypothetical protein